jgi:hypothetical protein
LLSCAPCMSRAPVAVPTRLRLPTMLAGSCMPQRRDGGLALLLDHVRSLPGGVSGRLAGFVV